MIPVQTKLIIVQQANITALKIEKMPNTNPVVIKSDNKYDRIDVKLNKEVLKMNERENKLAKRQQTDSAETYRKGSITYRSYSIQFKKQLVQSIREEHEATHQALSQIIRKKAKHYKIHPKNITRWINTKELKKKQGGRKALYPEMEFRLAKFIINNPKMKRKHILRQAQQIMEDLQIPGRSTFNFSKGWYERFRERLMKRKILSQEEIKHQMQSSIDSSQSTGKVEHNEAKEEYDQIKEEYDQIKEQYTQVKQQYNQLEEYYYEVKEEQNVKEQYKKNQSQDENQVKQEYEQINYSKGQEIFMSKSSNNTSLASSNSSFQLIKSLEMVRQQQQ